MSDYSQILIRELGETSSLDKSENNKEKDKEEVANETGNKKISGQINIEKKIKSIKPKNSVNKESKQLKKVADNFFIVNKKTRAKKQIKDIKINQIWLSLADAATIGGIQAKTLRRAIKNNKIKYKIIHNRYSVDFSSMILYLLSKRKLRNKLKQFGIGQYVKTWNLSDYVDM